MCIDSQTPKRCPVTSLHVYLPPQTMKRVSTLDISTPQYPAQCLEHPSLLTQTLPTSALGSAHVLEISFLRRLFKRSFLYPSCTLSESPKNLWKLRCSSHTPRDPGIMGLDRSWASKASQGRNVVSFVTAGKHRAESRPKVSIPSDAKMSKVSGSPQFAKKEQNTQHGKAKW